MHKQEYLDAVSPFIEYLVAAWCGEFHHAYKVRNRSWCKHLQNQDCWRINNLRDAFEQYWWKGTYQQATQNFDEFRRLWEKARVSRDQAAGKEVIINIFRWGGVLNHYTKRSLDNTLDIFEHTQGALRSLRQCTDDTSAFHQDGFLMNSAYAKLYAILDDQFIIYDGRVGAALGLLVRKYLSTDDDIGQGRAIVPLLTFPFKKERGTMREHIRIEDSIRNPSNADYKFREVNDPADHAKWMLRASWIIEKVVLRLGQPGVTNRHIEAALFMVGYQVRC